VALAELSDVDDAVRAASDAFGGWSESSLTKRTGILFAFRELVRAHIDELAALITAEHGKVLSDARGKVQRGLEVVEFACGIPQLLKGRVLRSGVHRHRHLLLPAATRRCRRNHAVQLSGHGADVDEPGSDRLREHLRAEAGRDPSASRLIAELWAEAGLPDGVFNGRARR
jgi:malonate-semialdehyde dehydrogenase (acetylating)/methylmalonate-semialdehyde dehydrogenase